MNEKIWYVRSAEGAVYGPASAASLLEWVKDGRVGPTGYVSRDRRNWVPPQTLDELEMKWLVESEPGRIFGPFHRELVKKLAANGSISAKARIYRLWELPVDKDPEPQVPVVVESVAVVPSRPKLGGIFKGADPDRLVALEVAARKELTVAKKFGIGGIFGRKK